jgi:hypothetical protein
VPDEIDGVEARVGTELVDEGIESRLRLIHLGRRQAAECQTGPVVVERADCAPAVPVRREALGLELEIVASAHDSVHEQDGSLGLVALLGAAGGAGFITRQPGVSGAVRGFLVLRARDDEHEGR